MKSIHLFIVILICLSGCSKESNTTTSNNSSGSGGSLAKFAIANNFLYVVDMYTLKCYSLSDQQSPSLTKTIELNWNVETVFPYNENLFIGTTNGMYVLSIKDPGNPEKLGQVAHLRSCDPVVANDSLAFVTLRGGTPCGPATEGLYVYNTKDPLNPHEIKILPISTPHGLGLRDTIVYVCRMQDGLSIINVKKPDDPKIIKTIKGDNFQDVIPYNNLLITYVSNGLVLYDISTPAEPQEVTRLVN